MHQWLVPHVVLPLYERWTGRRPWTVARCLRRLQWQSREELDERALRRVRAVLAHAGARVPFYRDLFARARVAPEDVTTLSALARLPVVTRADLRENFPDRTTAEGLPAARRWLTRTSGSTARPFEFYADRAGMDSWLGSHLFFLDWLGAALWTPRMDIFGPPGGEAAANTPGSSALPRAVRALVLGERVVAVAGVDLTLVALRAHVDRFPRRRPYFVRASPSYAARLATQLLADGRALDRAPIAVMTGAETLTPVQEATIRRGFGCRVVNHYSTWEVPHMAQTCPDNPGLLHVNSERVALRVVDADGRDVRPGERGRVLITALANDVMPFINYELGDVAVRGDRCPCGRGFPTLAAIEGRTGEVIETADGRAITPAMLGTQLPEQSDVAGFIADYQADQTAPDAVTFRVVPLPGFTDAMIAPLRGTLERLMGPTVRVSVEAVDRIPDERGKRLIVKSYRPRPESGPRAGPDVS